MRRLLLEKAQNRFKKQLRNGMFVLFAFSQEKNNSKLVY
ncbi:hypothetical protein M222_1541 [Enterococcus faecalis AZ19]|nr:hypothetical protein CUI_1290 [Enterococcus faecalis PC1.1]KAJ74292.1 hypothetical protein M222_1541 [Enterococcus faecalis AZ19]OSH32044.1 hypothetical protein WZ211_1938 [Enterococcus faecalis]OSH44896.1 hypothetical protein YM392_2018 [Enterococcus faecalis]SJN27511.1 hypothetical protein FM120_05515 [Sphingobacterium faecium PCAi_F2.5]